LIITKKKTNENIKKPTLYLKKIKEMKKKTLDTMFRNFTFHDNLFISLYFKNRKKQFYLLLIYKNK